MVQNALRREVDPESAAAATRRLVLGAKGAQEPLLEICRFAQALGVEAKEVDLSAAVGGCEAVVAPRQSGGFAVLVDPTPLNGWTGLTPTRRPEIARQRFRFRVAHEIAHTIFYERPKGRPPLRHFSAGPAEEVFCDRYASALLLPRAVMKRCFRATQLLRIHDRYDVSLEVAVRAWNQVHRGDVALFYWTVEDQPQIQWTSTTTQAARAWLRTIAQALREAKPPLAMLGDAVLLPARGQALVLRAQR